MIDDIVSLIAVRLNDIISGMEEEKTTLCYSLGEGLKGRKDSVSMRRYIARMKSEGSFRDADLWESMAKETGRDAEYIRYLEGVRRKAIIAALKSGKRGNLGVESHRGDVRVRVPAAGRALSSRGGDASG